VKEARDTYVDQGSLLWTDTEQKSDEKNGDFLNRIPGPNSVTVDFAGDTGAPSILGQARGIEAYEAARDCHARQQRDKNYPRDFVEREMATSGIPADQTDPNPHTWGNLSKSYADWFSKPIHPIDDAGKALASGLLIFRARDELLRLEWEEARGRRDE
jgi:hypothetical protein